MAGLLAANILRRYNPVIHEAQATLPDNHGALLRFRSAAVAEATGQRFQRVFVRKAIKMFNRPGLLTEADLSISNMYSYKVSGEIHDRSILNMVPGQRWIAPPDFILAMADSSKIILDTPLRSIEELPVNTPILSTIPMPVLMQVVGWSEVPEFRYRSITSVRVRIERPLVDVYQTIYFPDPVGEAYYRASLTGNLLTVEYGLPDAPPFAEGDVKRVLHEFGINPHAVDLSPVQIKTQKYGKLLPIDEKVRRAFIYAMTNEYGIYSVGRFATWRQILMDDVVKDVNLVRRFIEDRDSYKRHLYA